VPLETPLDDLALEPVDGVQAIGFVKALEFTALTKRIAEKTGADPAAIEPVELVIEGWPPEGGLPAHGPDLRERPREPAWAAGPGRIEAADDVPQPLAGLGAPQDLVEARKKERLPAEDRPRHLPSHLSAGGS
jgi:DNA polymerase-1